jgi:putative ABC transport system substrate-binding protein
MMIAGAVAASPLAAHAQQIVKAATVGFLFPGSPAIVPSRIESLFAGVRAMGLQVPEQVRFELRLTAGDRARLEPMAADLVERKVDVIVAVSRPALLAARLATGVIPTIALDLESDPISSGFVASYARPGGNVTGYFFDFPDFGMKWLELIKETIPSLTSVVAFWDPDTGPAHARGTEAAAKALNIRHELLEVRTQQDIVAAFAAASQRRADAVLILSSPIFGSYADAIGALAVQHRLPAVTLFPELARAGVMIAYGPDLPDAYRQVGVQVGKVLRGSKPADLPIERPTKFELIINARSARTLGVAVPNSLLVRADEVIE